MPVAKGERGHPTRTRTRVYRVPNMHPDRNAKESGSMAWQSEHKLVQVGRPLCEGPHRWVKHFCVGHSGWEKYGWWMPVECLCA